MAYDNPDLRKVLLPTLPQVSKAMQKADAADDKSRDVRPLMSMIMRLPDADPRLGGHLLTRQTAITSFDWVLEGGDDDDAADAAAARLAPAIDHVLSRITETPLFGALAMRGEWTMDPAQKAQVFTVVEDLDPDQVERPTRRRADVRRLEWSGAKVTRVEIPEDDPTWIVAIDTQRSAPGGVLRSVLIRVVLASMNLQEWSSFLRKLKGIISGQFNGGVPEPGDAERDTADAALTNLVSGGYALHSQDLAFKFEKMVDAAGGASFKDFKTEMEADAAVAILGQANTAQLPSSGGSRAALEVLNLIRRDIHHADIRLAERVVQQQLVDRDYRINVDGKAVRAPWRFRIQIEQDQDHEANARALVDAADVLERFGGTVETDDLYNRLGLNRPDDLPDVLTPRPSSPLLLPGAGAAPAPALETDDQP